MRDETSRESVGDLGRDAGRRKPDLVRWGVQVMLLALVSPALVAVLLVGGVCAGVQKIVHAGERAFAVPAARVNAAAANSKA